MRAATVARSGNKHTITLLTLRRASQEFRALHAIITLLALRNTERKTSPLWVGLGWVIKNIRSIKYGKDNTARNIGYLF